MEPSKSFRKVDLSDDFFVIIDRYVESLCEGRYRAAVESLFVDVEEMAYIYPDESKILYRLLNGFRRKDCKLLSTFVFVLQPYFKEKFFLEFYSQYMIECPSKSSPEDQYEICVLIYSIALSIGHVTHLILEYLKLCSSVSDADVTNRCLVVAASLEGINGYSKLRPSDPYDGIAAKALTHVLLYKEEEESEGKEYDTSKVEFSPDVIIQNVTNPYLINMRNICPVLKYFRDNFRSSVPDTNELIQLIKDLEH